MNENNKIILDIIELAEELKVDIKEIELKVKLLRDLIAKEQYEYEKTNNTRNTLAFRLYGKAKKDLTKEELKDYTRIAVAKAKEYENKKERE